LDEDSIIVLDDILILISAHVLVNIFGVYIMWLIYITVTV